MVHTCAGDHLSDGCALILEPGKSARICTATASDALQSCDIVAGAAGTSGPTKVELPFTQQQLATHHDFASTLQRITAAADPAAALRQELGFGDCRRLEQWRACLDSFKVADLLGDAGVLAASASMLARGIYNETHVDSLAREADLQDLPCHNLQHIIQQMPLRYLRADDRDLLTGLHALAFGMLPRSLHGALAASAVQQTAFGRTFVLPLCDGPMPTHVIDMVLLQVAVMPQLAAMQLQQHLDIGSAHLLTALSAHSGLRQLHICANSMTPHVAVHLIPVLRRLAGQLQDLELDVQQAAVPALQRLAAPVGALTALTHLALHVRLSGAPCCRALAEIAEQLPRLRSLSLQMPPAKVDTWCYPTHLHERYHAWAPLLPAGLTALTALRMAMQWLQGADAGTLRDFCSKLTALRSLQHLDIDQGQLPVPADPGWDTLNLRRLGLSAQATPAGMLAAALAQLSALRRLSVGAVFNSVALCKALSTHVQERCWPVLTHLSFCVMSPPAAWSLDQALTAVAPQLRSLWLDTRDTARSPMQALPLTQLQTLSMYFAEDGNTQSVLHDKVLLPTAGSLTQLTLDFTDNQRFADDVHLDRMLRVLPQLAAMQKLTLHLECVLPAMNSDDEVEFADEASCWVPACARLLQATQLTQLSLHNFDGRCLASAWNVLATLPQLQVYGIAGHAPVGEACAAGLKEFASALHLGAHLHTLRLSHLFAAPCDALALLQPLAEHEQLATLDLCAGAHRWHEQSWHEDVHVQQLAVTAGAFAAFNAKHHGVKTVVF